MYTSSFFLYALSFFMYLSSLIGALNISNNRYARMKQGRRMYMSGYLSRFKRAKSETRDQVVTSRLSQKEYETFKSYCDSLNISMSEAIAKLIQAELSQVGDITPVKKSYRKRQQTAKGFTSALKVDGELPCPVCGSWYSYKNFARHVRRSHGTTSQDLLSNYREKALAMFRERKSQSPPMWGD